MVPPTKKAAENQTSQALVLLTKGNRWQICHKAIAETWVFNSQNSGGPTLRVPIVKSHDNGLLGIMEQDNGD